MMRKYKKGQTTIEFMLTFPMVMLMVMLAIFFGVLLAYKIGLIEAVREAGRVAAVSQSCGGQYSLSAGNSLLQGFHMNGATINESGDGAYCEVTASIPVPVMFPWMWAFMGETNGRLVLSSTGYFYIEPNVY